MARPTKWRVRVKRWIEDWVEVEAHDKPGAYVEAEKLPGVASVFLGSAIPSSETLIPDPQVGVQE